MHWATQYIGMPWVRGAHGPDSFDCWGFVRFILHLHYGIYVPNFDIPDNQLEASKLMLHSTELTNWRIVPDIGDGHIVMMAKRSIPLHIGICIMANERLGILHCVQHVGVLFQDVQGVRSSGFGKLSFYKHHSCG